MDYLCEMIKIHSNSKLLPAQRAEIRRLYLGGEKLSALAVRYNVNVKTVKKWAERENSNDLPSGPKQAANKLITPAYEAAIKAHRLEYPKDGYRTIAYHLKERFSFAKRGTVQLVLQKLNLSKKIEKKVKEKKV